MRNLCGKCLLAHTQQLRTRPATMCDFVLAIGLRGQRRQADDLRSRLRRFRRCEPGFAAVFARAGKPMIKYSVVLKFRPKYFR